MVEQQPETPDITEPEPPPPLAPEQITPHTLEPAQQSILNRPPPQIELGDEFPVDRLTKLDEQLSRPKWVVPVRPGDDLEMLLRHSIKLCNEGEGLRRRSSGEGEEEIEEEISWVGGKRGKCLRGGGQERKVFEGEARDGSACKREVFQGKCLRNI
jgi:hypothetical protein